MERDEPVSPGGRLFNQPDLTQIIHCSFGCKNPIDAEAFRSAMAHSDIVNHPRFCSLMVTDRQGREHWRQTQINLDHHIIVREELVSGEYGGDDEDAVNDYVADLSGSSPLSTEKPLWEVHLLRAHRCVVFRFHHALGDGISLIALLLSCCRTADGSDARPVVGAVKSKAASASSATRFAAGMWRLVKAVCLTVVFAAEILLRGMWKSDRRTAVSGCDGVEMWPRKIATAKFMLDDMKAVRKAVPQATLNDVLFGIISCGLSRYLNIRSPKAGLQITGVAMVNLREKLEIQDLPYVMEGNSRSSWGNKFGIVILPVNCYNEDGRDSILYVKRAKAMMDRKKQSFEAHFSYKSSKLLMSCFGPKATSWFNHRIISNTSFVFANVVGPQQEITMADNPITYIRGNHSSLPNALSMLMVSYAGRAEMQILVAKDIIPNPKVLAKCFEDSLFDMKKVATNI